MSHVDPTSPWARVDFTPAGMVAPEEAADERTRCHDWMVYAAAAHRGQSYLYWTQLHAIAGFLDIALGRLADLVEAGERQRDLFDPWTVTVEEVAIMFAVPTARARALVGEAMAAADRLPSTANLLREGILDRDMFTAVAERTDIVEERDILTTVDDELAAALARAGHISAKAAARIADRIVATHDADAVRRRHAKKQKRKNVTHRDYQDGLGGIHITADAEETRLAEQAVDALAAACCPNDPRSIGLRRSAAAIARLRRLPFTCACTDPATCTARLDDQEVSDRQASLVIHAVCQKSTLDGDDDLPGILDGHGPVSAAHVRQMAQRPDAIVRDLDLDELSAAEEPVERPALIEHTGQPADPYRPTAALDTLVRAAFGTCTVPGCERAAWSCQLDHVEEYNQLCPASGGPTCLCNLGPKCLKHHQLKTRLGFADSNKNSADSGENLVGDGWIDDLWIDDEGLPWTSITVHGITVDTPAPNRWLLPQLADLRCRHRTEAPPEPDPPPARDPSTPAGGGLRAATAYKHAWRRSMRARLRRERDRAAENCDPPPF